MATIRVSFAELRTTGHYSNMRAEASIETESQDPEQDFPALWERVRNEVRLSVVGTTCGKEAPDCGSA